MGVSTQVSDPPEVKERFEGSLLLADRMARRFHRKLGTRFEYDDLQSAGRQGLWKAARKFDPERGISFPGYAHIYVRQGIIDEIRTTADFSKKTFHRALALRYAAAANATEISSAAMEIAALEQRENLSGEEAEQALDALMATFATATAVGLMSESVDTELSDSSDVELDYSHRERLALIRAEIAHLDERESKVVTEMYFNHRTTAQIGEDMGLDQSWVSRLHMKAMSKLKKRLKNVA